ncbi:unnamed protein product [Durusdinium trenchii]|uniref:Uncharacterized protein n=1 Tax=Durusdinium trenchii TaxID=1381693 RepID=A0ABP0JJV1_9DINO
MLSLLARILRHPDILRAEKGVYSHEENVSRTAHQEMSRSRPSRVGVSSAAGFLESQLLRAIRNAHEHFKSCAACAQQHATFVSNETLHCGCAFSPSTALEEKTAEVMQFVHIVVDSNFSRCLHQVAYKRSDVLTCKCFMTI